MNQVPPPRYYFVQVLNTCRWELTLDADGSVNDAGPDGVQLRLEVS